MRSGGDGRESQRMGDEFGLSVRSMEDGSRMKGSLEVCGGGLQSIGCNRV